MPIRYHISIYRFYCNGMTSSTRPISNGEFTFSFEMRITSRVLLTAAEVQTVVQTSRSRRRIRRRKVIKATKWKLSQIHHIVTLRLCVCIHFNFCRTIFGKQMSTLYAHLHMIWRWFEDVYSVTIHQPTMTFCYSCVNTMAMATVTTMPHIWILMCAIINDNYTLLFLNCSEKLFNDFSFLFFSSEL